MQADFNCGLQSICAMYAFEELKVLAMDSIAPNLIKKKGSIEG